jgi:hypothetical protein
MFECFGLVAIAVHAQTAGTSHCPRRPLARNVVTAVPAASILARVERSHTGCLETIRLIHTLSVTGQSREPLPP